MNRQQFLTLADLARFLPVEQERLWEAELTRLMIYYRYHNKVLCPSHWHVCTTGGWVMIVR